MVLGAPHNLTTDQRGAGFPRLQGAHVDIGAFEYEPPADTPQTSPITVTKTGDTNDGFCGVLDCSLREAISSGDSGDKINIPMGVYTLTVAVQHKCPSNCSAEMSPVWSTMVSDGDIVDATGDRRVGGLSASTYLLTVSL